MPTPWKTKQQLKYSVRAERDAKLDFSDVDLDLKVQKEAVNKARKYFDEFNSACSISSRHVLAFIHHDGTNIPFQHLNSQEQIDRMSAGQCLHYTKAGILALVLHEELDEVINHGARDRKHEQR